MRLSVGIAQAQFEFGVYRLEYKSRTGFPFWDVDLCRGNRLIATPMNVTWRWTRCGQNELRMRWPRGSDSRKFREEADPDQFQFETRGSVLRTTARVSTVRFWTKLDPDWDFTEVEFPRRGLVGASWGGNAVPLTELLFDLGELDGFRVLHDLPETGRLPCTS